MESSDGRLAAGCILLAQHASIRRTRGNVPSRHGPPTRAVGGVECRHALCIRMGVSNSVALLAEPDRALRDLMQRALAGAGYEVFASADALQVEIDLRVRPVNEARNLLYVLTSGLAADCAPAIAVAALQRAQNGLPEPQLLLTNEFGTLTSGPEIAHCIGRGFLEKPFDLYELQAIAFECRDFLCEAQANGTSA
jgi:hypothetical protein